MRSKTGRAQGAEGLRAAIQHTGYYPDVVSDAVFAALAGEDVADFYLHHEPTFDHDEVRRHLTVVVITPSRLLLTHTDEHPAGDEVLPEPYTSTSTEAIVLSAVRNVAVTRMVTSPTDGQPRAAEAVLTIGWGAVGRIDIEPASCSDPDCDADHGYTGVLAGDDFSLRVSAAAEGPAAVDGLLDFADSLAARTRG